VRDADDGLEIEDRVLAVDEDEIMPRGFDDAMSGDLPSRTVMPKVTSPVFIFSRTGFVSLPCPRSQ
jgi:hypothetical protein